MKANRINLQDFTLAELAGIFNAIPVQGETSPEKVRRFSDKKSAIRRISTKASDAGVATGAEDTTLTLAPGWEFDLESHDFAKRAPKAAKGKGKAKPGATKPKATKAAPDAPTTASKAKGKRMGIGEYIAEALLADDLTADEIAAKVRKRFPGSTATRADVYLMRSKLRKENRL